MINKKSLILILFGLVVNSYCDRFIQMVAELSPNEVFCFYEGFKEQKIYRVRYGVVYGDMNDVDFYVEAPNNNIIYSNLSYNYIQEFNFHASLMGDFKFCFSNNLIPYSTKRVLFELAPSDLNTIDSLREEAEANKGIPSVMGQQEFILNNIHLQLANVSFVQDYFKYEEIIDKAFADSLLEKVTLFSVIQLFSIILTGFLQVTVVKGLFSTKSRAQK